VLGAVLAVASGAIGGAWGRRSATGALPGAVLALTGYLAVGSPEKAWSCLVLFWASAQLVGPRRQVRIDLPLDGRIIFALFTGFLLRGTSILLSNLLEFGRL
jgi:hypothetical protein